MSVMSVGAGWPGFLTAKDDYHNFDEGEEEDEDGDWEAVVGDWLETASFHSSPGMMLDTPGSSEEGD